MEAANTDDACRSILRPGFQPGARSLPRGERQRRESAAQSNNGTLAATDTALAYAAGDPNFGVDPNVVHVAYSNNTAGALTSTLYGIDTNTDSPVMIGGVNGVPSPNGGQLTTIGPWA